MEALGTLLSALLPNAQGNTPSSTDGSPLGQTGAGNGGSSPLGQNGNPADMLMKLLETLIPAKMGRKRVTHSLPVRQARQAAVAVPHRWRAHPARGRRRCAKSRKSEPFSTARFGRQRIR